MMTRISDLTFDLEEEILSRVSITSLGAVRSTCKPWRALCKDPNFTKKNHGALMTYYNRDSTGTKIFNIRDLPSIKEIGQMHCPVKVWHVYVCEGLLLCVHTNFKLLFWNPYLGQTRYIEAFRDISCSYVLGYDNNNKNNPKVLGIGYVDGVVKVQIYDLKSNLWRVLDIATESIMYSSLSVSLKGNVYFVERKHWPRVEEDCVVCFDFTTERLRSPLHVPFNASTEDDVAISCIRGEQLALFKRSRVTHGIEFWITINIEHNAVSWTKLFNVDMKVPLEGSGFQPKFDIHRFFVDEEKKVALVCGPYSKSYVIGEDGNCKELDPRDVFYYTPSHVCLST